MKTLDIKWLTAAVLLLVALGLQTARLQAQSTAFTYNGRLDENGVPANGDYEITFSVYDAEAGGNLVAGPQPQPAQSITIVNGLFRTRLDFGEGIFTGPARWLELHVRKLGEAGFTTIAPRQELTSSPYSIFARAARAVADNGIGATAIQDGSISAGKIASGQVVKSLNGLSDLVTLEAGANMTITPDGNSLVLSSGGGGGSGPWGLKGSDIFYTAGRVGIGVDTPQALLDLSGTQDALHISGYNPLITLYDSNSKNARSVMQSVNGGLNLFTENYLNGSDPFGFMRLDTSGNVGIGSAKPAGKLEIAGQDALRMIGFQPFLTFFDSNAGYAASRIQSVSGDLNLFTDSYISGANPFSFIKLSNSGNVGVGSANPVAKLEVVGQDALRLIGYQPFLTLYDSNAGYAGSRIQGVGGEIVFEPQTYVAAANQNSFARLNNDGNFSVASLTIRGGADLAEPFDVTSTELPKGSVVVIDSKHPGKLTRSEQAYDKRVAGIISGANGIAPGLSMSQSGLAENGRNVALTGRVYVLADAVNGAIEPGDQLTTSDTPGHAMKVTDYTRAHGAVLGKAMSGLKQGRGMVLVLVTLQ